MENKLDNMEEILSRGIPGFHQYVLTEPVHLSFVSESLCEMTGAEPRELLSKKEDLYIRLVHPGDREAYAAFIRKLAEGEQTLTARYRLLKKDGSVLPVSDTVTVKRREDGVLTGWSVLTRLAGSAAAREDRQEGGQEDAGGDESGRDALHFLQDTIPCGFIRYTCEKQPRVTYINRRMLDFLGFSPDRPGGAEEFELYKDNIFLMVPMEERRRFAVYLERVRTASAPVAGEMSLLRCDGSRLRVFGWVSKCVNEQGEEEFQSVCMDVTERYQARREKETRRYLRALTEVYNKIFEYNLEANTVKCLYSDNSPMFRWTENIPMQMGEATEKWIGDNVDGEDQEAVLAFFGSYLAKRHRACGEKPAQIRYRARSSDGKTRLYQGIFIQMDAGVSLYCCRRVQDEREAAYLRSENLSLKENMQELVMRFTEGIAAFEVKDGMVKPLYASDNVCEFFGLTREEWLPLMKKSTPIREFIARSSTSYENIEALLRNGEAEFTYFDLQSGTRRRIKAICSQKSPEGSSPRYIMLYNVDGTPAPAAGRPEPPAVEIRTFGYFDVFVGKRPIAFRNKKSKELFALLVDRRGGYVSSEEAIAFLWEDEPVNPVTLARYRKVALRLRNLLEEYGIADVVESVDGKRRIVTERVHCDLYDYLSGREEYAQLFKGSYLTNYSWGESTLAELAGEALY